MSFPDNYKQYYQNGDYYDNVAAKRKLKAIFWLTLSSCPLPFIFIQKRIGYKIYTECYYEQHKAYREQRVIMHATFYRFTHLGRDRCGHGSYRSEQR